MKNSHLCKKIYLFILILCFANLSMQAQWVQIGSNLEGNGASAQNGVSVTLSDDGMRMVIGANAAFNGSGVQTGYVKVFEWDNITSDWVQLGNTLWGTNDFDNYGYSVSISPDGNRIIIGVPTLPAYVPPPGTTPSSDGLVQVYEWDAISLDWVQVGTDIGSENSGDLWGISVSSSYDGIRFAAGAQYYDSSKGYVRVFEWNGSTWTQMGSTIYGDATGDESYRTALSANGERLIVGAGYNDNFDLWAGHIRVYEWNTGISDWVQMGGDIEGQAKSDQFGTSVAISASGYRIAAGSIGHNSSEGNVRVFEWNGSTWTQLGPDIDGQTAVELSGSSIDLSPSANKIIIGATGYTTTGGLSSAGCARVYEWSGASWIQVDNTIEGLEYFKKTGNSVAISTLGNRIAVGDPLQNSTSGNYQAGLVRTFEPDIGVPLSMQTLNFKGNYVNNENKLTWQVMSKKDIIAFKVMRSIYSEMDFKHIGTIKSEDNDYTFIDKEIEEGKIYYYQLHVLYENNFYKPVVGKSNTIEIHTNFNNLDFEIEKIYPNPSSGVINVLVKTPKITTTSIFLIDNFGKKYFLGKSNLEKGYHELSYDISSFPKSVYYLELLTDKRVKRKKLILN